MTFRGTQGDSERLVIAEEYAQAVARLIACSHWQEMPALEDQLPDAWMPATFRAYWLNSNPD